MHLTYRDPPAHTDRAPTNLVGDGAPDRDLALEGLARVLFEKMEHLDPSNEETAWDSLPYSEQRFYLSCIERLALERDLLSLLTR